MTFEAIYQGNLWNGVESLSGPGSGTAATARVRLELQALVAELGITSVLDVACGDGWWMPDLPGYMGMDVSPTAIARAHELHPDRWYQVNDARHLAGTHAELIICRDAMQHMPLGEGVRLLQALMGSGAQWLLASTYRGGENVDVEEGDTYSPDLEQAPFSLWPPERLIFDGYHYHETSALRDPRKHLALWRLRR